MSGFRDRIKPRLQDWMMGFMNDLRPETVGKLSGDVLEMDRFRHKGPSIVAQVYRGVASRSDTAGA